MQKIFILTCTCMLFIATASRADTITLVGDPWCPYNCEPGSTRPGILIEVARKAFTNSGHTIKYLTVPWSRAIEMVRHGKATGIVGTGPGETPDFVYTAKEILQVEHTFFVRSTDTWRYQNLESLTSRTLGVIRGYSHGDLETKYILPNVKNKKRIQLVSGHAPLPRLLKMLTLHRLDTLIDDSIVFTRTLKNLPGFSNVKPAGVYAKEKIFIAFSPALKSSQAHAETLSRFIEKDGGSGVKAIIDKYLY